MTHDKRKCSSCATCKQCINMDLVIIISDNNAYLIHLLLQENMVFSRYDGNHTTMLNAYICMYMVVIIIKILRRRTMPI